MKNSTKALLIGFGTLFTVGAIVVSSSNMAMEKIESKMNRKRARYFVKDKLKGNENAMSVIDDLSDMEVANLLGVVDKVSDLRGSMSSYGEHLKDTTHDFKETLMDKKSDLKHEFKHQKKGLKHKFKK
ncbi:hypothetical protein [Carnobacterium inhibens]|uniref:Uncharacterized protein n=2 Tax=Carnobacterium inhibens TaxID=147709 RepID=U5S6R5_9LACT|nr:hypothetical protein [Carnobacterium inhibens]AGY80899.1 hypothetical protein Q783_00750 [Carnobacterium inhibens subsp. gilichinskyi]MBC9826010.1 hypothetical protein [Carnobacterium inhibens]